MDSLKSQVANTAKEMARLGLVAHSWGNVSARVPKSSHIVITPSGLDYDRLNAEDMVIVNLKGNVLEGQFKPSVETPMHAAIYQNRSDVNAVVHTHSPFATCLAVVNKELPLIWVEQAAVLGSSIPVTEYVAAGTHKLGEETVKKLGKKLQAVLLRSHSVVAVGQNLEEALKTASTVEGAAQIYVMSLLIGNPKAFSKEEAAQLRDFYLTRYGQK
jgi:L-ribulose-5-phosphate 4-epimerase